MEIERSNNESSSSLHRNLCANCNEPSKYTCPKCSTFSCSLKCVNVHKEKNDCDGIRDRTTLVSKNQYNFWDDLQFMEDIELKRDYMKRQIRDRGLSNGYLPRNLFRLRKAALSRGTNLAILPQFYSKRRESTCYLDYKDHKIFWRLEWTFPHSINPITLYDERVDEETLLANCLDKYLLPQSADTFQGQLDYYRSYGHAGVSVVVKDEGCPANVQKYKLLKQYKSLKGNFRKLTIIEYPKLIVVPNIHLYSYLE